MMLSARRGKQGRWVFLALVATGVSFAIPSCEGVLTTFNPCGTIFAFCEPWEIDALFADVPDFEADPTCVVPFYGEYGLATQLGTCGVPDIYPQTPGSRPAGQ